MHIAVAGNIGAGKTTLTDILANHYGWTPNYEGSEDNPYLNDFYNDMPRWSFNLQIHFLHSRLQKILDIKKSGKNIIQDRSFYEVSYIFAENLYEMGLMTERDYGCFMGLFNLTNSLVQPPDLIIYLRAKVPTLLNQIKSRGRAYEQSISPEYLNRLNHKYESWASQYNGRIMTIDIDNLDFQNKKEDREKVILMIDKYIKKNI